MAFKTARQVAELVNDPKGAGGSALIIDYGGDQFFGSSLRVSLFVIHLARNICVLTCILY